MWLAMTAAVRRGDEDDTVVESREMDSGDIVIFEPGNGSAFILASPGSVIDLHEVWSR